MSSSWLIVLLLGTALTVGPWLTARTFSTPTMTYGPRAQGASSDLFAHIAPAPTLRLTNAMQRADGMLVLTTALFVLWITLAPQMRRVTRLAAREPVPNPGRRRRALLHAFLH